MRMTTLHVSRKFNLGNYESMDLGGEFSLEETDTLELATLQASQTINTMFNVMQHPESVQVPDPAPAQEPAPVPAPVPAPAPAPEPAPVNPTTEVPVDKDPFAPAKEPEPKPAPAAPSAKKHVTFADRKILYNLTKRIEKNGFPIEGADKANPKYAGLETYPVVDMEFLHQRYTFDERAEKALTLAIQLNTPTK